MTQEPISWLEERGYQARMVSLQHLRDLREEIEAGHGLGFLDEAFYQERLTGWTFSPPEGLPDARSLIVVAVPQPQVQFTFAWEGKQVPLLVPPTYLHWRETDRQVEDLLAEMLRPRGYSVAQVSLPKKLLAVHSGLAAYGRNNISYVPGMGSFHRLVALCSDFPCLEDTWHDLRMMGSCQNCSACLRHCPAGAIPSDRFLLRAERCIAFHNESSREFPDWLDPSWHRCLVGCLRCQEVCPANKDVLHWVVEGGRFSQEESVLLLQGTAFDRLPPETAKRLEQADLVDLLDVLPRNLCQLLHPGP